MQSSGMRQLTFIGEVYFRNLRYFVESDSYERVNDERELDCIQAGRVAGVCAGQAPGGLGGVELGRGAAREVFRAFVAATKQNALLLNLSRRAVWGCKSLTMTYFHTGTRTIIGAKSFHCPVRDGKEWDQLAMVIRHNLVLS
jgi:hypothetical protein